MRSGVERDAGVVTVPVAKRVAVTDYLIQGDVHVAGDALKAYLVRPAVRFVDRAGDHTYIESTAPIYDRDHREVIGHIKATETGDRWFSLRDRALTEMLNFTLITSAVAVTATLAFAAWLAWRLSRLRRASVTLEIRIGDGADGDF